MQSRGLYHLHIELDEDYGSVRKRNRKAETSSLTLERMRVEQKKHIDIWTDGRLYPVDPIRKSTPPFSGCASLMRFVGDGQGGLLGYTQNLAVGRDILRLENYLGKQEIDSLKQQLEESKESIKELQIQLKRTRSKITKLGIRQREKKLKNIEYLRRGGGGCSIRIKAAR